MSAFSVVGVRNVLFGTSSAVERRTITSSGVVDGLYVLMTYANRDVYYKALSICCMDVGAQIQVQTLCSARE